MTNNKELKDKFIEYFSKLPIQKLAADYIGRSEDTIIDWKKADIEFANRIATAKSEWALDKVGKVRSKEWLLERIMKEQFAQRTELTGKDGKDLPTPILGNALPSDNSNKEAK